MTLIWAVAPETEPTRTPEPEVVRTERLEIDVETQLTWAIVLLTTLIGMVGLIGDFHFLTRGISLAAAIAVYLALALGFSISVLRLGLFTSRIFRLYEALQESYPEPAREEKGVLEKILVTGNNKPRKWFLYLMATASFVCWCLILVGSA